MGDERSSAGWAGASVGGCGDLGVAILAKLIHMERLHPAVGRFGLDLDWIWGSLGRIDPVFIRIFRGAGRLEVWILPFPLLPQTEFRLRFDQFVLWPSIWMARFCRISQRL
jgi:hypothetical protein